MEEKKYIDRLYQEKFKDFEAAPRRDLWKNIAVKLKEEEKKKTAAPPLWTRLAGIAAILSLILLLGDWLTQPSITPVASRQKQESSQKPSSPEALAATDSEEASEIEETAGEKLSDDNGKDIRNSLIAEISSIIPNGIKRSSGEEKKQAELREEKKEETSRFTKTRSLAEEILEEQLKENKIAGTSRGRIEISTHAAPIYYGNLKSGNFIDSRFSDKNSAGEVTYSYGINVSYKISENLKIRSGVNKVTLSHSTSGVPLNSVLNPYSIAAVDYRDLSTRVVNGNIIEKGSGQTIPTAVRSSMSTMAEGLLNQKMGFIEIPVELEYNLINKTISVNLIGGASTLFLDENSVSITSERLSTVLGEANNLNEVSFSTNIGLGFDYNFSEKLKINLEPMFKYQINTFDAASGTYQPYYIGIYSGFSYKF